VVADHPKPQTTNPLNSDKSDPCRNLDLCTTGKINELQPPQSGDAGGRTPPVAPGLL
jgi:hypothetical protein